MITDHVDGPSNSKGYQQMLMGKHRGSDNEERDGGQDEGKWGLHSEIMLNLRALIPSQHANEHSRDENIT